jgi:hypothetical protein
MALQGSLTSRYQRANDIEKYIDKLIVAKSIDTFEGSIVVIKDLEKKLPKNIDMSTFKFGEIKPVKGPDACLTPDVRYKIIIYQAAWEMLKPANQKLAILYLLNRIKTNDNTGEPALWKEDVKGYKAFYKKYGFDWLWDDNVPDPLTAATATTETAEPANA